MAIYQIELPVTLVLNVTADNPGAALRHVDTAFAHKDPVGGMVVINLILRRGEMASARLIDARPTGDAALAVPEDHENEEAAQ